MQVEHESIRSSKGPDEFLNADDYKRMTYTQRVRLFFVPFFFLSFFLICRSSSFMHDLSKSTVDIYILLIGKYGRLDITTGR
jgi:hypothetical protein